MRNYAYWLANFLEWLSIRKIEAENCNYLEHVYGGYQYEMLSGTWSRDGTPLSPMTVNLRVQQACDFLTWMSDKNLRPPFTIPKTPNRNYSASGGSGYDHVHLPARKGKVRQVKRRIQMPRESEIARWLDTIYRIYGEASGLMCETILLSAMRREEIASFRIDTLPEDPHEWHINNVYAPVSEQRVLITIRYGTKGPCYGYDHGDKIGPQRSIWLPLSLANRLHKYRMTSRHIGLKIKVAKLRTLPEKRQFIKDSVHLFIDERSGDHISSKVLYCRWKSGALPFKAWSPHLGRDWWACSVLSNEMKNHENLLDKIGPDVATALLESTAMSIIRLRIQPQLGHASDSTCLIYLQWIMDSIGRNLAIRYEEDLLPQGRVYDESRT
jgi:integrase